MAAAIDYERRLARRERAAMREYERYCEKIRKARAQAAAAATARAARAVAARLARNAAKLATSTSRFGPTLAVWEEAAGEQDLPWSGFIANDDGGGAYYVNGDAVFEEPAPTPGCYEEHGAASEPRTSEYPHRPPGSDARIPPVPDAEWHGSAEPGPKTGPGNYLSPSHPGQQRHPAVRGLPARGTGRFVDIGRSDAVPAILVGGRNPRSNARRRGCLYRGRNAPWR